MDNNEFTKLVADMRQSQRDYFKSRNMHALDKARTLERKVDAEINQRKNPTLGL